MSTTYELVLLDPRGKRLPQTLTKFDSLDYAMKVNDVGSLTLELPAQYPLDWFGKDYRIEVWRKINEHDGVCDGDTQWLIRKRQLMRGENGRKLKITAYDLNTLLKRRIIAYDADTVYTDKADFADDMIKEIVSENFGVGCIDGDRDLSDWLDIQGDFGLAMPIEKAFARRYVLPVIQEIAESSYQEGIYLTFGMVRKDQDTTGFKTWINQRGTDHSKGSLSPIIFSSKEGNFSTDEFLDDSTDEATFVYAGGQGEEADRMIETAKDDARIGISPFGRIETFVDARQAKLAATVQEEADAELRRRRPLKRISGKVVNLDRCCYGIHYKFGDKVTAETEEISMDAFINSVHVTLSAGIETIDIGLEAVWG